MNVRVAGDAWRSRRQSSATGGTVTVELAAGRYAAEWFNVATREASAGDEVAVGADGPVELTSPWPAAPAVLYLVRSDGAERDG